MSDRIDVPPSASKTLDLSDEFVPKFVEQKKRAGDSPPRERAPYTLLWRKKLRRER
jgi:hypothetical protein